MNKEIKKFLFVVTVLFVAVAAPATIIYGTETLKNMVLAIFIVANILSIIGVLIWLADIIFGE